MRKQFGAKPHKEDLVRYATSQQWDGSKFVNQSETSLAFSWQSLPKFMYKQFCNSQGRSPKKELPFIPLNKEFITQKSCSSRFIWFGHSALFFQIGGKNILIDPMFGSNAAPISPIAVPRFNKNTLDIISDLPEIDIVLLTHDHYDHLDIASINLLQPKVQKYFVALGVARHLIKWGIPSNKITEFDWWENQKVDEMTITFTPTRHFSGRGLKDRALSLWGGWALKTKNEKIWFSGDSGYGNHFKEVGERLGPFDFGFMECGQYNENWHLIHMFPNESIQAAIDANVKVVMPVHWGAFALAQHGWKAPVEKFVLAAKEKDIAYIVPQLGQIVNFNEPFNNNHWWQGLE